MKRIAYSGIGLVLSIGLLGPSAGAQNQASASGQGSSAQSSSSASPSGSSLGDYARQIRKTPGEANKPKVFDNDNLPTEDKLSIVGTARSQTVDSATEAKSDETASTAPATGEAKAPTESKAGTEEKTPSAATGPSNDEDAQKQAAWKQWGDKIAAQKEQIDLAARELDVLQREYQIRAAAMYGDAGSRFRNQADWDKQDAQYKQQIADKQKAVDDAKQKLDDLQEDARKAGVPASIREP